MANVQKSIDDMKANFAELKAAIMEALARIDQRVDEAPEAKDDAEEIAAIAADAKGATQAIREALDKPPFEPSGN